MRRFARRGLIAAVALVLFTTGAEAWPNGNPFAGPPVRAEAWSGGARYGSPFAGPPVGELQNEAWGRYLQRQYLLNNPLPGPRTGPHAPSWAWIAPSWQWNGFQWVWVPGYWVPAR